MNDNFKRINRECFSNTYKDEKQLTDGIIKLLGGQRGLNTERSEPVRDSGSNPPGSVPGLEGVE